MLVPARAEAGGKTSLFQRRGEMLTVDQNHSSAEYPWRNPREEANIVACGQGPEELCRSGAPHGVEPGLSAVSSQEECFRDAGATRDFRPTLTPPSHRSGAGSQSSNNSPNNTSAQEGDSWGPGTLVRFRVHHYFDYVVGTSTGGYVLKIQIPFSIEAENTSLSTLMLSRLGMDIDDALQQYATVGNGVFAHRRRQIQRWGGIMRPKYASANMNRALQRVVEHGSKKETIRRNLPNDEIRLLNSSEPKSCRT